MKKGMRYTLCVIGFICIFLWLFQFVSHVLCYKVRVNDTVASFYHEKKDSIDVLFVGSSHSYRSFSPMQLWNETGITSYNLATASQSIPCSYYLIKEGIRLQHPRMIVLEVYTMKAESDYVSTARLHAAIDNIPLNTTKMEILRDYLPDTLDFHERLEFVFPIIQYHTRWSQLTVSDFKPKKLWLRGFQPNTKNSRIKEQMEPEQVTKEEKVYAKNVEYMDKIVQLCEDNNVQLVLVQTPMAQNDEYEMVCSKINALKSYADKKRIPYVSFEALRKVIDLDYSMDFKDSTHLSVFGAEKATNYMGTWLTHHFNLSDHRGEQGYEVWDSDYRNYEEEIEKQKNKILKKIKETTG